MSFTRTILGVAVVSLALAGPAAAQERTVRIFARSGGFNALTNLDDAGTDDFKKVGYAVGGGVGVQLHRFVTLRGDFTFARNELRTNGVETGDKLNRLFYDGAIQLQYPTDIGLEPYLFAGAGAVTLQQVDSDVADETKFTGTYGVGLNYQIAGTGLGLFVEGKGWLYQMSNLNGFLAGYDKLQTEVGWSAGLSYRIRL